MIMRLLKATLEPVVVGLTGLGYQIQLLREAVIVAGERCAQPCGKKLYGYASYSKNPEKEATFWSCTLPRRHPGPCTVEFSGNYTFHDSPEPLPEETT